MSKFYKCLEYISFSDIVVALFLSFLSLEFSFQWCGTVAYFRVHFCLLYCFTLSALGMWSIRPLTPRSLWKSKYHLSRCKLPLATSEISKKSIMTPYIVYLVFPIFWWFFDFLTEFFDDNRIKHGAQRHC